ncbi:unnamed protein product [Prorocentrum cordatum]|uniref:Uncharacterized protein n=1 Tax=Prorocentrum cordatum TaxID=2364126 RepID=A0ABN9UGD1_9DINO|nr:unnamed protein product [Polarella glacialis]
MLATMGYITPEIAGKLPGYLSPSMCMKMGLSASKCPAEKLGLKFADVPNGLAAVSKVPALGWFQIVAYFGFVELSGGFEDYRTGTPGDYGWKVLSSSDPVERTRKLNSELANGRLAMVAIVAMLFQNGVVGSTGPEMWLGRQA